MAVYILSDRGNNRIKIGYTKTLEKRLQAHRTSNPGLEVLAVLPDGDRHCEKALHRLLRGHQEVGTIEWFRDGLVLRSVLENVLPRLKKGILQ
jgi:hypothetical protein